MREVMFFSVPPVSKVGKIVDALNVLVLTVPKPGGGAVLRVQPGADGASIECVCGARAGVGLRARGAVQVHLGGGRRPARHVPGRAALSR
ncbi:unnamed protein product [Arctia plantaginis]|uniref:Uncharacterized protein n=1 Tax=Arctia plantaginis TaxID=874455 RepID=A0A8S0YXE4_ARCPL|nr:unnamed protein product [Arctia plantaginis]